MDAGRGDRHRAPRAGPMIGPALVGVAGAAAAGHPDDAGALAAAAARCSPGPGSAALVIGLGAREPRLTDFEEHQLVNVVEEMAIAAGLPAPRVMLLDGADRERGRGRVVAGRRGGHRLAAPAGRDGPRRDAGRAGPPDRLDRQRRPRASRCSMVTVFRTFGLVNTLLDAPVSSSARATLWRLIGRAACLGRGRDAADARGRGRPRCSARASRWWRWRTSTWCWAATSEAGEGSARARWPAARRSGSGRSSRSGRRRDGQDRADGDDLRAVGPLLALTWRTRRFLADATAVQLTRNPDGVARGLQGLLRGAAASGAGPGPITCSSLAARGRRGDGSESR